MLNWMVMFTFSILNRKHSLWEYLVQKFKFVCLRWNLLYRLTRIYWIRWWWFFFCFGSKIPFLFKLIHWFTANNYVMFQEIWNEFRGLKKHSDFLVNYNLRKRSIKNKLFIHSVKINKDFFKLIYHCYGLWIIRKDESLGIKDLLKNTSLKSNWDKKKIW